MVSTTTAIAVGVGADIAFIVGMIMIVSASPSFIELKTEADYPKHASALNEVGTFQSSTQMQWEG
jgi:hypothetical protein